MVISFNTFLTEETDESGSGKKLKHLKHIEDMHIHDGHEGVGNAAKILDDAHKSLLGKKTDTTISTKYDGAPSLVFGYHPKHGRFFVASKSAFNKNPKINYTNQDIEDNHGHAPGLVSKLKDALQHLPKITPKQGVYQGDVMHSGKNDVTSDKGQFHFQPNTVKYSIDRDTHHGQAIRHAKFGVVIHTKYKGKQLEDMEATPHVDHENFSQHPDVHNINPSVKFDSSLYTSEKQRDYLNHIENAKKTYSKMEPDVFDPIKGHETDLEAHINDMVRKDGVPSHEGYMDHISNKHNKEIEKLKTEAGKDKKRQALSKKLEHIQSNKQSFNKALELHQHLQKAKNVLTDVMSQNTDFEHSIAGQKTGPEGFVAHNKGNMAKFVNRSEFSKMNLLGYGAIAAGKKQDEKV
jgi:hypothetical protein